MTKAAEFSPPPTQTPLTHTPRTLPPTSSVAGPAAARSTRGQREARVAILHAGRAESVEDVAVGSLFAPGQRVPAGKSVFRSGLDLGQGGLRSRPGELRQPRARSTDLTTTSAARNGLRPPATGCDAPPRRYCWPARVRVSAAHSVANSSKVATAQVFIVDPLQVMGREAFSSSMAARRRLRSSSPICRPLRPSRSAAVSATAAARSRAAAKYSRCG